MALSKSVIKTVDRTNLFYNKFCYRVVISAPSIYWVQRCKTIDDFVFSIVEQYEQWEQTKSRYPNGWYRSPPSIDELDIDLMEKIIKLVQKNNDKSKTTYRYEGGSSLSVYTNDLKIATSFSKLASNLITEVKLMPTGVMQFKKDPPAKYRLYTTNKRMSITFKEEFLDYLERTPDITPSNAFYTYLHRDHSRYPPWLWDRYYVDYNDEKNLMMMSLMFPGMIGKKYKLEKK